MRKFSIIFLTLFVSCLSSGIKNAYAIIPPCPTLPPCPIVDAKKIAVGVSKVKEKVKTGQEIFKTYTEMKEITQGKGPLDMAYAIATSDQMDALNKKYLDGATRKLTSNSRNIKKSPSYDITDATSVEEKLFTTLLIRGSDENSDIACQDKLLEEFKKDALLDVIASVDEFMLLLKDLDTELDTFQGTLDNGSKDIAGTETNNGVYEMQFQAADIMDKIKRAEVDLSAMDGITRYSVALRGEIKLISAKEAKEVKKEKEEKKKKEKVSSLMNRSTEIIHTASFKGGFEVSSALVDTSKEEEFSVSDFSRTEYNINPESDMESPFASNKDSLAAIAVISSLSEDIYEAMGLHNELRDLPSYRKIFVDYERQKQRHEKALELLKQSEQCTIDYLGKYYKNPKQVWVGGSNTAVNDYSNRKGISKWLMDMYDVAKNDMNPVSKAEDFGSIVIDASLQSNNLADNEKGLEDFQKNGDLDISEGKNKEITKDARKTTMLSWQIASIVSKSLANDQQGAKKWGKPETPFPIWNDQKNFYDQYIDYKHDNMIAYVKKADFRLAELDVAGALINSAKTVNEYNVYVDWINELKKVVTKQQSNADSAAIKTAKSEYLKMKSSIDNEKSNEIKSYENQIKNLNAKLVKEKEILRLYADKANDVESNKVLQSNLDMTDPDYAGAVKEVGELNSDALKNKVSQKNKEIASIENKMSALYDKIDAVNKTYSTKYAKIEHKMSEEAESFIDTGDVKEFESLVSVFNKLDFKNATPAQKTLKSSFENMLKDSSKLVDVTRDYAEEVINRYRSNVFILKEDLYYQSSNSIVQNNHKKMIDELKTLKPEQLMSFSKLVKSYSSASAVLQALSSVYKTHLINQICKNNECYSPDTEYFVGAKAVARDFKAPKEPINEYLPPMREVVYFDLTNFQNLYNEKDYITVELPCSGGGLVGSALGRLPGGLGSIKMCKYKKYFISKNMFLNSETSIPLVWKMAFSGFAFVERDIDMEKLLGSELPEDDGIDYAVEFYRAGIYPCALNGKVIDTSKDASYIVSSNIKLSKPACRQITLEGKNYYTVKDFTTGNKASLGNAKSAEMGRASELGRFFYIFENKIIYKEAVRKSFIRLAEIDEYNAKGKDYDKNIRDDIYGNASFDRNQFGDFIKLAEVETSYRESVDELKVSVDELRNSLIETLQKYGFSPSKDLDLAKDSDYNLVQRNLKSAEKNLIESSSAVLKDFTDMDNEVVKERYDMVNNVLKAMIIDSDNMVSLSNNVPTESDLRASILAEKTNMKVKEEHDQKAKKAMEEDESASFIRPYCASY